jgi:hypothetical protein
VWLVPLAPSVATYILNWFFFPKSGFLGIYLNLQRQKSFKKSISPHNSESKSYQINSIKSCSSSRIFPTTPTKGTFLFLWNSQLPFNIISSEEIIQYSRNFCTTSPKHHEAKSWCTPPPRELSNDTTKVIWSIPGLVDLIGTNKPTTFLQR